MCIFMEINKQILQDITQLRAFSSVYTNTTPIVSIAGIPIYMNELALAAIIPGINMVFLGKSGPGKSQLISDIKYGIFNGNAVHLRGSADLRIRPIYCSVNLELLKEGKADEAVKPRNAAFKPLHILEEFNRAPPVCANEFLAIADSVLDIDGVQVPLGNGEKRYSIAIGAANIGNGEFSGTFQTDNALKERLVFSLDFDGINKPTELDYFDIFENSSDPRVVLSKPQDNFSLLLKINQEISNFSSSIDYFVRMLQIYLIKGLDEVTIGNKMYSKDEVEHLGSKVENDPVAKNDLLNYVSPLSVRAIKVFGGIVPSLTAITLSKNASFDTALFDSCFSALELIMQFSDSLPKKILANNSGSRKRSAQETVELIRKDVIPVSELMVEGIRKASCGILTTEDTKHFEKPRIRCFGRFLTAINSRTAMANLNRNIPIEKNITKRIG